MLVLRRRNVCTGECSNMTSYLPFVFQSLIKIKEYIIDLLRQRTGNKDSFVLVSHLFKLK